MKAILKKQNFTEKQILSILNKKKKLYIDEINSIPTCFSHHLWEEANISYKELFTIMINDTIKNINRDTGMVKEMDMTVLKGLKNSDIKEYK